MSCLRNTFKDALVSFNLNNKYQYKVVGAHKQVIQEERYWPLVSDLYAVLSHPDIAFQFMKNDTLLASWFDFLKVIFFLR